MSNSKIYMRKMGWFVRKGGKWENRTGPHEEMGKEIHSMGR